ncbi:MAG: polysaccharide pyruvyl transferase family protein [Clostridiales bacterium]|nr:polysaccharide pyruvyl transferase family protein [Clostridiales bacterium]
MATIKGLKNRLSAAGRALAGQYITGADGKPVMKLSEADKQAGRVLSPAEVAAKEAEKKRKEEEKFRAVRFPHPEASTIEMLNPMHCCGCGACKSSCPVGAITMKTNDMGFIVPEVDHEKCVNCGKCKKACPVISTKYENDPHPDCHIIKADDETRMDSSSGGAFTLLATEVIEAGGYVCGVKLMDDFSVNHVIIDNIDQIPQLRGSKYVQSDTRDTFTDIKRLLDDGKLVMFTGCPCQAAGLKNFLGKDYDNLIVVDLICHGGPPQKVFRRYLEDTYGIENLADFKFRTKEYGYSSFSQIAYLKNGEEKPRFVRFDSFETAMHTGMAVNDLCADCPFAEAPRQGDITIGDFWGESEYKKRLNDDKGLSCVLSNNDKGRAYIDKIKDKAVVCEEVPFDEIKGGNRFRNKMRIPRKARTWLYNCMDYQPFDKVVEYAISRRFDVGIIGLWYGRNYGSMATYYALHQVLKKQFHLSVLMIDNPLGPGKGTEGYSKTHPRTIAGQFYDVSQKYSLQDMSKLNAFCDTFIIGSDQLWNIGLSRPYKQTYYLRFANETKKKISYATSFGKEFKGTAAEKLVNSYYLREFDHVSVRDRLSAKIATEEWGVENVAQTCDPTLLCPFEEYQTLVDRAQNMTESDYILSYILDPNPEIGAKLEQLSIDKNKKVVVLLDEPPHLFEGNVKKLGLTGKGNVEIKREVDLYEWMWYYSHANAVVTDSFHGTIFSIIFQKPFLTMVNAKRGAERFTSLLEPLGLDGRLFKNHKAVTEHEDILDGLDYTEANAALDEIRKFSMNWLDNALKSEKVYASKSIYSVRDITDKQEK